MTPLNRLDRQRPCSPSQRSTFCRAFERAADRPPRLEDRVMSLVRRALTLFALAALSLSLAGPATASLARNGAAGLGVLSGGDRGGCRRVGRRSPRRVGRRQPGRVREKDTGQVGRDLPKADKGRAPSIRGHGPGVLPRHHGRCRGRRHRRADPQPDQRAQPGFSGGAGGAATGFSFSSRTSPGPTTPSGTGRGPAAPSTT